THEASASPRRAPARRASRRAPKASPASKRSSHGGAKLGVESSSMASALSTMILSVKGNREHPQVEFGPMSTRLVARTRRTVVRCLEPRDYEAWVAFWSDMGARRNPWDIVGRCRGPAQLTRAEFRK